MIGLLLILLSPGYFVSVQVGRLHNCQVAQMFSVLAWLGEARQCMDLMRGVLALSEGDLTLPAGRPSSLLRLFKCWRSPFLVTVIRGQTSRYQVFTRLESTAFTATRNEQARRARQTSCFLTGPVNAFSMHCLCVFLGRARGVGVGGTQTTATGARITWRVLRKLVATVLHHVRPHRHVRGGRAGPGAPLGAARSRGGDLDQHAGNPTQGREGMLHAW